jgi:hypothetical protein
MAHARASSRLHRMPPRSHALVLRAAALVAVAALLLAASLAMGAARADAANATTRAESAVKRSVVHRYGVGTKAQVRCAKQGKRRFMCAFAARKRSDKRIVYMGKARVTGRSVKLGRAAKIRV